MEKQKLLEEGLVNAMDALKEQTDDKTTKILAELFKSVVLEKYQYAFDEGLKDGKIDKDVVDKAFEYRFSNACATILTLPKVSENEKERLMKEAKSQKGRIKQVVYDVLASKNIEITE